MYKNGSSSWIKHLDFTILDIVVLEVSFIISYFIRHGIVSRYEIDIYKHMSLVLILIDLCVVFFNNSYKGILKRGVFIEFKKTSAHMSIVVVISFAYMFFIQYSKYFSRTVFIFTWIIGIVLMFLGRVALKAIIRNRMRYRMDKRKVIVITVNEIAEQIVDDIKGIPYRDYYVEGFILCNLHHSPQNIKSVPVVSTEDTALDYLRNNIVDEVIFYFPKEIELPKRIIEGCSDMGITIHVVMSDLNHLGGTQIVEKFAGYTVLTSTMRMATPRQLFLKRVLDIMGATIGCVFCGIASVLECAPRRYESGRNETANSG